MISVMKTFTAKARFMHNPPYSRMNFVNKLSQNIFADIITRINSVAGRSVHVYLRFPTIRSSLSSAPSWVDQDSPEPPSRIDANDGDRCNVSELSLKLLRRKRLISIDTNTKSLWNHKSAALSSETHHRTSRHGMSRTFFLQKPPITRFCGI